jgi:hypothetical protein
MKYYKYLNLDWKPTRDKILEKLKENEEYFSIINFYTLGAWRNANEDIYKIPEIHEMFRPLNLNIKTISFFVTFTAKGTIHKDSGFNHTMPRINFPIINCEESETKFYEVNCEPIKMIQPNGENYYRYPNTSKYKHIDSYFLTQPVVFYGSEAHQVCNYGKTQPRISCTVEFHEDIKYLLDE